jgi:hypothetical protein
MTKIIISIIFLILFSSPVVIGQQLSPLIPPDRGGAGADDTIPFEGPRMGPRGFLLCANMQKLEVHFGFYGTTFSSVSESEGKGDFSITPTSLGRPSHADSIPEIAPGIRFALLSKDNTFSRKLPHHFFFIVHLL